MNFVIQVEYNIPPKSSYLACKTILRLNSVILCLIFKNQIQADFERFRNSEFKNHRSKFLMLSQMIDFKYSNGRLILNFSLQMS